MTIIAQINPNPGSCFSSYTDIIRLDKTRIMGLSSQPGLANNFPIPNTKALQEQTCMPGLGYLYHHVQMLNIVGFITRKKDITMLWKTVNTILVTGVTWLRIRFHIRVKKRYIITVLLSR